MGSCRTNLGESRGLAVQRWGVTVSYGLKEGVTGSVDQRWGLTRGLAVQRWRSHRVLLSKGGDSGSCGPKVAEGILRYTIGSDGILRPKVGGVTGSCGPKVEERKYVSN